MLARCAMDNRHGVSAVFAHPMENLNTVEIPAFPIGVPVGAPAKTKM
jgi:hypothetical protein